jgi:hypothetical protein
MALETLTGTLALQTLESEVHSRDELVDFEQDEAQDSEARTVVPHRGSQHSCLVALAHGRPGF